MKKNDIYNILNKLILIFLVAQPLLDIYMAVVGEVWDLFGISAATIIRTFFVISMFIVVIITQIRYKHKTKYICVVLGYISIVLLYSLAHHINIVGFDGYFIAEGIYNSLTELLYVLRLIIPVLLMYIIIITKPARNNLLKTVMIVAATISIVIVTTNLFKISFASYSQTGETIQYNIVDWFTKEDLTYKYTLSKGYFVSANQIGALLVFLLPMVIYYTLRENKWYLYLILLLQIISMVLVGTRVANYGWILVSIAMVTMYTILHFTKRYKLKLQPMIILTVILIIGAVLYANSPSHSRAFASEYEGMYNEDQLELDGAKYIPIEDFKEILSDEEKTLKYLGKASNNLINDAKTKYISEMYKYHYITNKYILEIYPYTDDLDFWLNIFEQPISVKGDNRGRQVAIIKRIKENNDNLFLDTLLGMGATPLNARGYMIENDLISHYYNLGIIGTLLFVVPYIFGIVYAMYKSRKYIFGITNMEFAVYVLAIVMTYFVGYFAGHVIDEYIISIYLGVISGGVFNFYKGGRVNG